MLLSSKPLYSNIMDSNNLSIILKALLAIALGSGGVIAIFYGLNILIEKSLPRPTQNKVLPWIYVGPSLLLLLAYLVLPTLRTIYATTFCGWCW